MKHVFTHFFPLLAILLTGALGASASTGLSADDPWVFTDGAVFELTQESYQFKSVYAVFRAESSGKLSISTPEPFDLYTDSSYSVMADQQLSWNGSYEDRGYDLTVSAGETYWLKVKFVMNYGTVSVHFNQGSTPIQLTGVVPAEGDVLNVGSANVSLAFNKQVSAGSARVKVGDIAEDVSATPSGAYLQIELRAAVMKLYRNGSLHRGDMLQVVVDNVCDANEPGSIYGTDGTLTINYQAGAKPIEIIATDNVPGGSPNDAQNFYSWYKPSDEKAVATFTFDGPVAFDGSWAPKANLYTGNQEAEGEYYSEELEVTSLDANTIAIDFRGKLRRPQDLIASGINYGYMGLRLIGVCDTEGNSAYSPGSGSIGSYDYMFTFKEVAYKPSSEFSPASGSTLDNVKNIELWLSQEGDGTATYDSIQFTFVKNGLKDSVLVDVTPTVDPEDANALIFNIPVPAIDADPISEVILSLTGVETPDGVAYPHVFSATYKLVSGTTGITSAPASTERLPKAYRTNGTPVNPHDKGLMIVNGKKIVK